MKHRQAVPTLVLQAAKDAFLGRNETAVATVVLDSLLDGDGRLDDHRLWFRHRDCSVDVRVQVVGQVALVSGSTSVGRLNRVVASPEGCDATWPALAVDGCFSLQPLPRGLVRLRFELEAGGEGIWTDWFRI